MYYVVSYVGCPKKLGPKNHISRNLLDMAPIPNDTLLPKVYLVMSGQSNKFAVFYFCTDLYFLGPFFN